MIANLFGNKNVEDVLFFLLIHGRCYGTKLHKQFGTSLTPIQKALEKLERCELITSFYEGKTRVYQFNATYPLLTELKALVKKGYSLLSHEEKKRYLLKAQDVGPFWSKLSTVKAFTITSGKDQGEGSVTITQPREGVLLFSEKGKWHNEISFTNTFRWTFDEERISLEHLRHGIDHPVFLFHFVRDKKNSLISLDPFLCAKDCYQGRMLLEGEKMLLFWKIKGPKKNEEITVSYR